MDAKNNEADRVEDVMMPGFRFHPTDEELVGFYLKRKIQQRSLPIELIKQVDIYKYDPWDLPKLASTGEKESYFYCPRDRKYRNSARPNRVTGAGFWKATGTDRPIYSSDGTKCIGLKKSLVFYRGRAARGIKTDWMMHEFRLPSLSDATRSKKLHDKSIPANDSWAICRIFMKTNSVAQRTALSQSWNVSFPEASASNALSQGASFSPNSISCQVELQRATNASFSSLEIPMYRTINQTFLKSSIYSIQDGDFPTNVMSLPFDIPRPDKCTIDIASMLSNDTSKMTEPLDYEGPPNSFNGSPISSLHEMQGSMPTEENGTGLTKNLTTSYEQSHVGAMRSIGFPFAMPSNLSEAWEASMPWDSPTCPGEMSPDRLSPRILSHLEAFWACFSFVF